MLLSLGLKTLQQSLLTAVLLKEQECTVSEGPMKTETKFNCVVSQLKIHQTDLLKTCHVPAGKHNFISILQMSTKLQHVHVYLFCIFHT